VKTWGTYKKIVSTREEEASLTKQDTNKEERFITFFLLILFKIHVLCLFEKSSGRVFFLAPASIPLHNLQDCERLLKKKHSESSINHLGFFLHWPNDFNLSTSETKSANKRNTPLGTSSPQRSLLL
jgi:hypothetical protein